MNALSYFTSFYAQDTWRIRPSLTLTYGLSYSWQTPYNFSNQEEALLVNATSNQLISPLSYLQQKAAAAEQGQIYNPALGFLPVTQSGRSSVYNTDYGDVAPRAALAWNPSFDHGILGKVLGRQKTVLRGGFGLYYSRLSTEDSVVTPGLTAGFSSSITTGLTTCAASGSAGSRMRRFEFQRPGAKRVPDRPGRQYSHSHVSGHHLQPLCARQQLQRADLFRH